MTHILIAEDEPDILTLLQHFFTRHGYQLSLAPDGETAIRLAQTNPPVLILLDIQMPLANGIEVMQTLRMDPIFANTPIVAITAYTHNPWKPEDLLALGFDRVIPKPFEIADLQTVVSDLLENPELHRRINGH